MLYGNVHVFGKGDFFQILRYFAGFSQFFAAPGPCEVLEASLILQESFLTMSM